MSPHSPRQLPPQPNLPRTARALLSVTALALGSMGCAPVEPASNPAQAADRAHRPNLPAVAAATVTLEVLREGLWGDRTVTEEGSGSGFVVPSDDGPVIVTAAHVWIRRSRRASRSGGRRRSARPSPRS